MKEVRVTVFEPWVRLLERLLPVPVLLAFFHSLAATRALVSRLVKGPRALNHRPPWLHPSDPFRPRFLDRLHNYANRPLMFFPDRLAQPKWLRRCRFVGLEHLRAGPRATGSVLAFVHLGPYQLLRGWLRAAGVPVSMLVSYPSRARSSFLQRHHARTLFPEVPPTFHLDRLADAIRHLRAGQPLALALDSNHGRLMEVPLADGWAFRSATGAIRLARKHGVPLVTCSIYSEGPWQFVVEISPPVPDEVWARGDEAVGRHLFAHIFPLLRRHPDQCRPGTINHIHPTAPQVPLAEAV